MKKGGRGKKRAGYIYYKNMSIFARIKIFFADGIFANTPVGNTNTLRNNIFLSM